MTARGHWRSTRSPGRSTRAAVLVALVVLCGGGLSRSWAAPSDAGADQGSLEVVDRVPIFEPLPAGRMMALVLDPTARRGYQITHVDTGTGLFGFQTLAGQLNDTVVRSFDLDTLRPLRRVVIPDFSPAGVGGTTTRDSDVVHAVDEQAGRLYLAGTGADGSGTRMSVAVIDEARLDKGAADAVSFLKAPEPQLPQLAGRTAFGMALRRVGGRAKLVLLASTDPRSTLQTTNDGFPRDHYLVQWDAVAGPGGSATADWMATDGSLPTPSSGGLAANGTYRLGSCQNAPLVSSTAAWAHALAVLPHATGIYLGCQGSGGIMQAVQVSLDGGKPANDRPFPFARLYANVVADTAGGRLLFETFVNGTTIVAFDVATLSYVGAAGLLQSSGYWAGTGLDPASGRLYALAPDHLSTNNLTVVQGGLMVSDTRLTPVPQFVNVRPDLAYPAHTPIRVDPAAPGRARRVFVRRGSGGQGDTLVYPTRTTVRAPMEGSFLVIRDTIPVAVQPTLAALDANTVPVPEEAGVAEATYEGNASGFGFRSLLVGGTNAVVSQTVGAATTPGDCYRTDRETVLGLAESARLSSLVASASGTSFDVDPALKADLERPVSRCWSGTFFVQQPPQVSDLDRNPRANLPEGARPAWDENGAPVWEQFRPRWVDADFEAGCIGNDGEKHTATTKAVLEFSATATCRQDKEQVEVKASGETADAVEGVVSVAHASSEAGLRRDPKKGLVAAVDSVARDIEITLGDTRVSIGLIRTEAESFAAGLPGTAGTDAKDGLKRTICGVHAPGYAMLGCTTEVKQVTEELNKQFTRYGELRLRKPDPAYAQGSPGGYLAAVQRDRAEAFNDRLVTRDGSNAVPGLELIVWRNDDPATGTGRQVFQFAAVEAVTAYGISCVNGARVDRKGCLAAPTIDPDPVDTGDFDSGAEDVGADFEDTGDTGTNAGFGDDGTTTVTRTSNGKGGGGGLGEVIRRIARLPVEGLKLLFSSPREMGLMAAVWALLWLPCYLGERRRLVAAMAGRAV